MEQSPVGQGLSPIEINLIPNLVIYFQNAPGVGKASDVIGAVKKGVADGKKHLVDIPITRSNSIPHPINGIGGGAKVIMRPAAPGTGVIAGGAVRTVLELAGVRNILAKQLGSNNPLNNARAAIDALSTLRTFTEVAEERGIPRENLYSI